MQRIHFDGAVSWDLDDGGMFFAQLIAERRILVAVVDQASQLGVVRAQMKTAAELIRKIV